MNEGDTVIVVRVPPQRLRWLAAELRAAGVPFHVEQAGREYHVQTCARAAPQLHKVLDPKPGGWDPLRRQRGNRSRITDALGFLLTLGVMAGVVWLSGGMVGPALALGLNPDLLRAGAILLGGLLATGGMVAMAGNDPRRWLLALGMGAGLGAALVWYVGRGMGVL